MRFGQSAETVMKMPTPPTAATGTDSFTKIYGKMVPIWLDVNAFGGKNRAAGRWIPQVRDKDVRGGGMNSGEVVTSLHVERMVRLTPCVSCRQDARSSGILDGRNARVRSIEG